MKKMRVIGYVLLALALLLIAYAVADILFTITNSGSVTQPPSIEVYWDVGCTLNCTDIDWGQFYPGTNKTVLVYLVNVGGNETRLNMTTAAWHPPQAETELALTWNYTSQVLMPQQVMPIAFTLTVAPNCSVTQFSFEILIGVSL